MNKYFVFILAFAAATQSAFADPPQDRHASQARAPQQAVQREQRQMPVMREQRQMPVMREQRQMPVQQAPVRQAPVTRERAIPAMPVREQRQGPMPLRQRPIVHERAIPAVPVRERMRPIDNSAAAAVWRDQHERNMPLRNVPAREMPRVFRGENSSAAAAVWRDQHEHVTVVRHGEFERFHPRRVFVANPVFVEPRIVTPTIVTSQFIQPAIAAPVFIPGVIDNGIAPVSYAYTGYVPMYAPPMVGYAPAFAAVPLYDASYVPYVNPVPFTTYAAYSDDCDDEDDNCYSPSYASYAPPAYTYVGPAVNPYGNAQLQGVVIGQTGNSLIVLAPNLQPVFVNTGVAAQAGYMQGSVQPGAVINALGYYVGNQFIATALV